MIGWLGGRVVVVAVVVVVVVCLTNLRALATLYSTKQFEDYSR